MQQLEIKKNDKVSLKYFPSKMRLTNEEKVEIVLIVGNNYRTVRQAADEFNDKHPERENISYQTVSNVMRQFRQCSVNFFKTVPHQDENRNLPAGYNEDDELNVLLYIQENPKTSLRQMSRNLDLKICFIRFVLQKHKIKPFKPLFRHSLFPGDEDIRLDFSAWILGSMEDDPLLGFKIIFSDEATFTTNGIVSSQNSRYWSTDNPHWTIECRSQYSEKVNVWCGIFGEQILGPVFFDENLNGENFLNFLEGEFSQMLNTIPFITRQNLLFQLDGAPCHFSLPVRHWLNINFPNKWIGRGNYQDLRFCHWPPRSPDLTPLDFFLWGVLKERVYKTRPRNRDDLRQRIIEECQNISRYQVANATRSFRKKLMKCMENNGGLFEL